MFGTANEATGTATCPALFALAVFALVVVSAIKTCDHFLVQMTDA